MDKSILARQILENPLWKETFETLGRYYYEEFRAAPDRETREKLALANDILDDFESFLTQVVIEGVKFSVGDNI